MTVRVRHERVSRLAAIVVSVAAVWTAATVMAVAVPEWVAFRAVCFDPRDEAVPVCYVTVGQGARKLVDFDKSRISDLQRGVLRERRHVDFFGAAEPREGEEPWVTVSLPAGGREHPQLFVFAPAGDGWRGWSIPLPPSNYPPGSTLLVNAAPSEVAVKIGEAKHLVVAPGRHGFLRPAAGGSPDMLPVQIFERARGSDHWEIVQSTRWPVDRRFRSCVFLYRSPATNRLMMHGLAQRVSGPGAEGMDGEGGR